MPSDDYAVHGTAGVLKIKGAKIDKKKKRGGGKSKSKKHAHSDSDKNHLSAKDAETRQTDADVDPDDPEETPAPKTESERQHQEAKKKRLLKLADMSGSRPELLKTHKERVEELNTYLSKLSEHHDMPKIGPG